LALSLYLALYTFNEKTELLDKYLGKVGLEVTGFVFRPVIWIEQKVNFVWHTYINLVHVQQENEQLKKDLKQLKVENIQLKTQLHLLNKLAAFFKLKPFPQYRYTAAIVIAQKLGPGGLLESIILNKGQKDGLSKDLAVFTPQGLVGRIYKLSLHTSIVLLAVDKNSKIAVISEKTRISGILQGQGYGHRGKVNYMPKNKKPLKGELLLTSGLDQIFPPGLPVAKIGDISQDKRFLFWQVKANFIVDPYLQEIVFVMLK